MQLNINNDAAVVFTNKLEKLRRSALPAAVRGTLNKAAFDVKQKTMPETAKEEFVHRQPNFFKANSRVEMAKGFDITDMRSVVGFTPQGLKGQNNFAVHDLEQQEHGGTIKKRSFIPTASARGGDNTKQVRPGNRLSQINKITNSAYAKGKNNAVKFIKSAVHAGVGGHLITNFSDRGKNQLVKVTSITRKRNGFTRVRTRSIYSFVPGRDVNVKPTGFMKRASLNSADKMYDFFTKEAMRQIEKMQ